MRIGFHGIIFVGGLLHAKYLVPCPRLSWACWDFSSVSDMPTTSVGMAPDFPQRQLLNVRSRSEVQPRWDSGLLQTGGRATSARFSHFDRSRRVGLQLRHFSKTFCQTFQEFSMKCAACGRQGIMTPGARFTNRHEVCLSQVGKMPRHPRLRHLENCYDISYAEFPVPQDVENAQSRPVRKSPEHKIDGSTRFVLFHIENGCFEQR